VSGCAEASLMPLSGYISPATVMKFVEGRLALATDQAVFPENWDDAEPRLGSFLPVVGTQTSATLGTAYRECTIHTSHAKVDVGLGRHYRTVEKNKSVNGGSGDWSRELNSVWTQMKWVRSRLS